MRVALRFGCGIVFGRNGFDETTLLYRKRSTRNFEKRHFLRNFSAITVHSKNSAACQSTFLLVKFKTNSTTYWIRGGRIFSLNTDHCHSTFKSCHSCGLLCKFLYHSCLDFFQQVSRLHRSVLRNQSGLSHIVHFVRDTIVHFYF
jgi:hypothetical protein